MDISGFHLIVAGVVLYIIYLISQERLKAIEKNGYSTIARVIDYERITQRVAGSYTTLEYPIVEYINQTGDRVTGFVKYGKSSGRYFSIGDDVEILVDGKTIYYKHAMTESRYNWAAYGLVIIGIGMEVYEMIKIYLPF